MADELPPLITYPVDYEFKIIGRAENDFTSFARKLVGDALGQAIGDGQVAVLPSSGGKFESVRITVRLDSEAQRVAVYTALSQHTGTSNQARIVFYL